MTSGIGRFIALGLARAGYHLLLICRDVARAEALRLPFYCVRAVTDIASEDMANDFNAALRADGPFDTMLSFRHALSRPVARIPELLRLRRNCERAARTLGEFFADCQL